MPERYRGKGKVVVVERQDQPLRLGRAGVRQVRLDLLHRAPGLDTCVPQRHLGSKLTEALDQRATPRHRVSEEQGLRGSRAVLAAVVQDPLGVVVLAAKDRPVTQRLIDLQDALGQPRRLHVVVEFVPGQESVTWHQGADDHFGDQHQDHQRDRAQQHSGAQARAARGLGLGRPAVGLSAAYRVLFRVRPQCLYHACHPTDACRLARIEPSPRAPLMVRGDPESLRPQTQRTGLCAMDMSVEQDGDQRVH